MSDGGYIKLAEAPTWVVQYPQCSACEVDLILDDGWLCPVCGSCWPGEANDGDQGELFESWSGETIDGDPVPNDDAWREGARHEKEETDRHMAEVDQRIAERRADLGTACTCPDLALWTMSLGEETSGIDPECPQHKSLVGG